MRRWFGWLRRLVTRKARPRVIAWTEYEQATRALLKQRREEREAELLANPAELSRVEAAARWSEAKGNEWSLFHRKAPWE